MFKFILVVFAMMILAVLSNAGYIVIETFTDIKTGEEYQPGQRLPASVSADRDRIQEIVRRKLAVADCCE
jgi:hypothetical protein